MFDTCRWVVLLLTLLVPSAPGQELRLFPESQPQEVRATIGNRMTVIPDGTDGMHYFPDGPLSILSARPLRFLMPMGNRTVVVSGRDFGNLTSQREVLGPSGSGPDANYAGIYAVWQLDDRSPFVAICHGENHEGMGRMEGNDINGAVWSVCLATIDPVNERIERRGRDPACRQAPPADRRQASRGRRPAHPGGGRTHHDPRS